MDIPAGVAYVAAAAIATIPATLGYFKSRKMDRKISTNGSNLEVGELVEQISKRQARSIAELAELKLDLLEHTSSTIAHKEQPDG